jgi:hypothetical protein
MQVLHRESSLIRDDIVSLEKLYRSSRLQHHQFCASGDLVAFAAEEAGYYTVLRGSDLLLHFHRFEDEQRGAGFDMLAGLHEHVDDLPSHGSVQVTSASGGRPSTLASVKEAIFSPLKLERNLSSFFVECRVVQESLGQLEDVLSHRDSVNPGTLWDWYNVHINNLVVRGAAPVRKFHVRPPIRQPS